MGRRRTSPSSTHPSHLAALSRQCCRDRSASTWPVHAVGRTSAVDRLFRSDVEISALAEAVAASDVQMSTAGLARGAESDDDAPDRPGRQPAPRPGAARPGVRRAHRAAGRPACASGSASTARSTRSVSCRRRWRRRSSAASRSWPSMNIVERRRPQDGQSRRDDRRPRPRRPRRDDGDGAAARRCVLRLLDKSRRAVRARATSACRADTHEHLRSSSSARRSAWSSAPARPAAARPRRSTPRWREINRPSINVMTIEDPVEYIFPAINQIQINEQAGITFAGGLRSILRQDPDVILVGEIRDVETARIAVQSALTGHFVLSSLHATDAVAALHRFLDMGIESFLIASSVVGVVGQRLVRRICDACKVPYEPDPTRSWRSTRGAGGTPKEEFLHGEGCNFCAGTGYQDRIGVYELLRRHARDASGSSSAGRTARGAAPARRRAGHAHAACTRRSASSSTTSPRSPKSSARLHGRLRTRPMPTLQVHRRRPDWALTRRRRTQGPTRSATSRCLLTQNELFPVKIERAERKFLEFEITKKKVQKPSSCTSPASSPCSSAPASRSSTPSRRSPTRRTDKVLRRRPRRHGRATSPASPSPTPRRPTPRRSRRYYIGVLRSAEMTGHLDTALDQLADYIDRDIEAGRKISRRSSTRRSSLAMSIGTVVILAVFVLPQFKSSSTSSTPSCRCRPDAAGRRHASRPSSGSSRSSCVIVAALVARRGWSKTRPRAADSGTG